MKMMIQKLNLNKIRQNSTSAGQCEKSRTLNVDYFTDIISNIMSKATKKVVYISAVNGQYVPKPYAITHPNTTVRMVVKTG